MITYKDCPECGARKISESVALCEVCETWAKAEQAIAAQDEVLTRRYNEQLARAEQAEARLAQVEQELAHQRPPRPKDAMIAFSVEIPTTNAMQDTGKSLGEYFQVQRGCLIYIAKNAAEVAAVFPDAITIHQIGVGYPRPA